MNKDYRNSKYCPDLVNLVEEKQKIREEIMKQHPRAIDMHTYISDSNKPYKKFFSRVYNGKCAYCGVSLAILPLKMFEIDHLVPKVSKLFGGSKAKAGGIDNLVFSCYDCNRAKSNYECSDEDLTKINPDQLVILDSFERDEDYYIRISDKMQMDSTVRQFYEQIGFGNQAHRIDYLLLNMRGLCDKITDKHPAYSQLNRAVDLLQRKRNTME